MNVCLHVRYEKKITFKKSSLEEKFAQDMPSKNEKEDFQDRH